MDEKEQAPSIQITSSYKCSSHTVPGRRSRPKKSHLEARESPQTRNRQDDTIQTGRTKGETLYIVGRLENRGWSQPSSKTKTSLDRSVGWLVVSLPHSPNPTAYHQRTWFPRRLLPPPIPFGLTAVNNV